MVPIALGVRKCVEKPPNYSHPLPAVVATSLVKTVPFGTALIAASRVVV